MKYIEYILTALLLVNLMARDVIPDTRFDAGILSVGMILVLFYFFGFWWLHKPPLKNFRTISISILYMLACCSWAFSIQFVALFLTGDVEMVILSAILTAFALLFDMATSVGKLKVMNATLVIRLCAFAITCCILVSIPQHVRVHYTFRNDPAFLKFYDENIDALEFMDRVRMPIGCKRTEIKRGC